MVITFHISEMQVDFNAIGHPRWLIALYANKKDVDNYVHPFMTHNLQVQVTWMLLASFAHGVQPFSIAIGIYLYVLLKTYDLFFDNYEYIMNFEFFFQHLYVCSININYII